MITYTSQRFKASSGAAGNSTGSSRESWKYTVTVTAKAYRDKSAEGQVAASASREFERYSTGLRGCNYENRQKRTVSGSANEQARVHVRTAGDRYSISYSMPMVEGTGTHEESSEIKGQCNNPYNKNSHRTEPVEEDLSPGLPVSIEGRIDPANPNVLRGSESVTTPLSGGTASARVSWSFVRCPE